MTDPIGEKLSDFKPRFRTGPKHKYPYDTWFAGGTYRLVKGKQFTIKVASMEHLLRQQAKARDLELSVYGDGPGAIVIVVPDPSGTDRRAGVGEHTINALKNPSKLINEVKRQGCRGSLKGIASKEKRAG